MEEQGMKKIIILGLVLLVTAGCVSNPNKVTDKPADLEKYVVRVRNLDFERKMIWLAAKRAVYGFYKDYREHRFTEINDWDRCYPDRVEVLENGMTIPYSSLSTWYCPIVYDVRKGEVQRSRRALVKILPDGKNAWQCEIRFEKYYRRPIPVRDSEDGWVPYKPDLKAALEIKDNIHNELQLILERKRKGIKEPEF
jgi:hypothetical protein